MNLDHSTAALILSIATTAGAAIWILSSQLNKINTQVAKIVVEVAHLHRSAQEEKKETKARLSAIETALKELNAKVSDHSNLLSAIRGPTARNHLDES